MPETKQEAGAAGSGQQKRRGFWDKLTPGQKKMAMIAGAAGVVLVFFSFMNGNATFSRTRAKPIENVLTDRSSRELGLDSLTAQIKLANDNLTAMRAENRRLKKEVDNLRNQVDGTRNARQSTAELQRQLQSLQDQMSQSQSELSDQVAKVSAENERLNKIVSAAPAISGGADGARGRGRAQDGQAAQGGGQQGRQGRQPSTGRQEQQDGTPEITPGQKVPQGGSGSSSSSLSSKPFLDRPVNTRDPYALYAQEHKPADEVPAEGADAAASGNTISVIAEPAKPEEAAAAKKKKPDLFLPTGTMLHGVLLSGLYAPTGVNARKDPFPVVLRVQDEAIMPNLRRADLRECFLTLSGYGDLSSERALLRGETMSCIANDNSVIEAKFPGYAVGEDGKAGIRGKLITRNGRTLRNAMLAGFASGIGEAFQSNAVPKLDISSDGSTTYQAAFSSRTLNNGLFNGASEALNRLADYYMSLAEQTFPVIEVNAGRDVTVTLTQGTELSTVRGPDGNAPEHGSSGGGAAAPSSKGTPAYEHQPTPELD